MAPDEIARSFSTRAPIGTPCVYYPLKPFVPSEAEQTRIRSKAWVLGHGAVVVMIEGRSGGVSIEHIVVEVE
jgi:hypothetical protein